MKKNIQYLTHTGLIAALYTVLGLVIPSVGYGTVQFRVSEVLTILPAYMPTAIPGLTVGCFISNLIGLSAGVNPAGAWDLLVGTAATAVAAVLTYWLRHVRVRKIPLLSTVPPVAVNALAIGAELALVYPSVPWYWHVLGVAAGQTIACCLCGTVLAAALNKTKNGQLF